MHIQANTITVDEGPPIVIGFADDPNNPHNYVLLSCDLETGEGLYAEINDQIRSGYKLVERVRLTVDTVSIELTPAGAQLLDAPSGVLITISPCVSDWSSMRTGIAELLRPIVPVET